MSICACACRHLAIAGAVVLLMTTETTAQAPTFRTRVESVRLDLLVTDADRPITGLTAGDFDIEDSGVRQTVDYVSVDTIPINLVLTLDMSESVAGTALEQLRQASKNVLGGLRSGDQAALLTFGEALELRSPLTGNLTQVREALDRGAGTGRTSLADASYGTMWVADGDPGRTLAIVFSDGVDTSSWLANDRVFESAKRSDLVIYGVSTGTTDLEFLEKLCDATGGRVFALESTRRLSETFAAILEEFRHRYVVSYTPTGVGKPGWHKVEVRVKSRRAKVSGKPGYLAGPS